VWRLIPRGISRHTRPPPQQRAQQRLGVEAGSGAWRRQRADTWISGDFKSGGALSGCHHPCSTSAGAQGGAPEYEEHRAERLSMSTQAQEGHFVSLQALAQSGSFARGLDNFYGFF